MRVVIIGSNGQLAQDLHPALQQNGHEVIGLTHAQIEVAELDSVRDALTPARADVVINTSAYHKVDVVEEDPDRAFAVNATGARNVAVACRELNAALVHLSTDYVFSGRKGSPYVEGDAVDPVNLYGVSKAAGEMAVRYLWPRHWIVRTSGLYGVAGSSGKGGNFVELMLRLAHEGKPIRVVNDQTLTPTSTRSLARQISSLIETGAHGTYHATCQGACTWYDFTIEIFAASGLKADLSTQTTAESGAEATRPAWSVLANAALQSIELDLMPNWQDALREYLREREMSRCTA
ncbi:MAG: dTDP-4-dehydrorhamnose reductase [Planctomycetes bacterium]|nr:dTDP-4-dehydrorhamnose reductase [Planctomycetota bacterium]